MTESPKDDGAQRTPEAKLPYERPSVISEEVFETLALSCANARGICSPSSPNQS